MLLTLPMGAGPWGTSTARASQPVSAASFVETADLAAARPTTATVTVSTRRAKVGEVVTVSGTVPPRSRAVLQRRAGRSSWSRARLLSPSDAGRFRTTVTARYGRTSYRVLTVRRGRSTRSTSVAVRVPRPVHVQARPERAAVASGATIRLQGQVTPVRGGVPVQLVRHTARGAQVEARGRSSVDGSFSLATEAPVVDVLRSRRYSVGVPARPVWERASSRETSISIAPGTGLAVDESPVAFDVGPEAGVPVDVPVELEAGQTVIVDASAVTPQTHNHLEIVVLDPTGEPVVDRSLGDSSYGPGFVPEVSGTHTVRLTVGDGSTFVSGLVWVSTPRVVPIEVDGAPVDIPARRRPGQTTWLTFDRDEGDRISVGCVAVPSCQSDQYLVAVGHHPLEQGPIGPGRQDLWYPIHTGPHYLEHESRSAGQVWVTSANQGPLSVAEPVRRLEFTRPGQAYGFLVPVVAGQRYSLSVLDRGLFDPRLPVRVDDLQYPFDVAGSGHLAGGYSGMRDFDNHGRYETTFTVRADGLFLLYVDPVGPMVGPMDIDITEVADAAEGP